MSVKDSEQSEFRAVDDTGRVSQAQLYHKFCVFTFTADNLFGNLNLEEKKCVGFSSHFRYCFTDRTFSKYQLKEV